LLNEAQQQAASKKAAKKALSNVLKH